MEKKRTDLIQAMLDQVKEELDYQDEDEEIWLYPRAPSYQGGTIEEGLKWLTRDEDWVENIKKINLLPIIFK